ncbi:hypothetical protein ACFLQJ_01675 [Calditrichota bacterium]
MITPPRSWVELLRSAAGNRTSGAAEIALSVAYALLLALEQGASTKKIRAELDNLLHMKQAMAPVLRIALESMSSLDEGGLEQFSNTVSEWKTSLTNANETFLENLVHQMNRSFSKPWVLLSCSSTVLLGMKVLAKVNNSEHSTPTVYIAESRPGSEGVEVAGKLAEYGWRTLLMPDTVLFDKLITDAVEVIILGCDAIDSEFFVNKSGSAALAALASSLNIPVEIWTTTHKILPQKSVKALKITEQGDIEFHLKDVQTEQPLFSRGKIEHMSLLRTELGVMSDKELQSFANKLTIIPQEILSVPDD